MALVAGGKGLVVGSRGGVVAVGQTGERDAVVGVRGEGGELGGGENLVGAMEMRWD